jgi:hypothetical protein
MASTQVTTVKQSDMQHCYYAPRTGQNAEKAYQPNQGDPAPPVSSVPTVVGGVGVIVILDTTIYNRNPGKQSRVQLIDFDGLLRYNGGVCPDPLKVQEILTQHPDLILTDATGATPFVGVVGIEVNRRITVRPMTGGTMAQAINKASYTGCNCQPPLFS